MKMIEKVRAALAWYANDDSDCADLLRELEGMVIMPIEPNELPKGFTSLDYAVLIDPYLSKGNEK